MENPADEGIKSLKAIISEFSSFVSTKGKVSEADTRVKFIDRVLKEVCQWPETDLSREDKVESGHTDYQLRIRQVPTIAVEAKREGVAFMLPTSVTRRALKLNGVLTTDPQVKEAVLQVRQYCDDQGIKYAIATNGYTWIVFRAIRDDMPWREGFARVFPSIEYIEDHFVEFWNLLYYEAICQASLDNEFGRGLPASRKLLRVVDRLFNADLPLRRNRINRQLRPIITYIFEDIAAQDDPELLKSCYVHTQSLRIVAKDLNIVITDAIPKQLIDEGTQPIMETEDDVGAFGRMFEDAIRNKRGELYLLLGGIGAGKTTFLKRYEKLLAKKLLEQKTYTFHLDFIAPPESIAMETFVWNEVLETLRHKYPADEIEKRRYLKSIFKDKLHNIERTALRGKHKHTEEYELAIGPHLLKWQENLSDYVPKLLRFASILKKKSVVLFIDNVDQLDPDYQASIFLLAQRITKLAGSVTIIVLREESYFAPSIQNTFTAYTSHKFHIASPRFRAMIENRIKYAIRALKGRDEKLKSTVLQGQQFDTRDICEFLLIVQSSVFEWSRKISRLIKCLCFGNMRLALEMFTTFLTSGATDVDKMLLIYRRDGAYNVAFHEFLKSVMLQSRAYYKEDQSPILNVFNCTSEKKSSHFTALRIIAMLLEHRSESASEGRGYVELSRLIGTFADIIDNVRDVCRTLDRLVNRQLIEVNTRSTLTVSGASHVRVTASGWYYVKYLSRIFAYLDLVLQDTPLNDAGLEHSLRQSVYDVNNLADREFEKYKRMQVRFDRTQKFLDYLTESERYEFEGFGLAHAPSTLTHMFMPEIQAQFKSDRQYIEQRLLQGPLFDTPDEPNDNSIAQFGLQTDDIMDPSDDNRPDSSE